MIFWRLTILFAAIITTTVVYAKVYPIEQKGYVPLIGRQRQLQNETEKEKEKEEEEQRPKGRHLLVGGDNDDNVFIRREKREAEEACKRAVYSRMPLSHPHSLAGDNSWLLSRIILSAENYASNVAYLKCDIKFKEQRENDPAFLKAIETLELTQIELFEYYAYVQYTEPFARKLYEAGASPTDPTNPCIPNPCLNDGICKAGTKGRVGCFTCVCSNGFIGDTCETAISS